LDLEKSKIHRDRPVERDLDCEARDDKQKQDRKGDEVKTEVREVVKREFDKADIAHVQAAIQKIECLASPGEERDPICAAGEGNSEVPKRLVGNTSVTVRLLEARETPVAIFRQLLEHVQWFSKDFPPLCAALMAVTEHLLRGLRQAIDAE
jgi:hypothetical protein